MPITMNYPMTGSLVEATFTASGTFDLRFLDDPNPIVVTATDRTGVSRNFPATKPTASTWTAAISGLDPNKSEYTFVATLFQAPDTESSTVDEVTVAAVGMRQI